MLVGAVSGYDAIARLYDPWSRSVVEDVSFYVEVAVESGGPVVELAAARRMLVPGGKLVFDVFAPAADDIAETHGVWIEREPGIFERARWDLDAHTLTLDVRGEAGEATLSLSWLEPGAWQALLLEAGFAVEAVYGWFDRRPYAGGEDTVFVARRSS